MPDIKVYVNDEEAEYVKERPKGWVRTIIARFRDTEGALTPDELIYLRDHGGTKGVIAIAKGEKSEGEFNAVTGEMWVPSEHGGEVQPRDGVFCRVCERPLYSGVCRNTSCAMHGKPQEGIETSKWEEK